MKILLVTQYFYPENFKSNDIAFELAKKGMEVDVLCGIPNYPKGKYYKGYSIFKRRVETINEVRVYRAFQFPRGKGGIRLFLNYISFVFSGSLWALFLAMAKRYDCVIVHEPSPVTQGLPAILLCKIKRIPLYFWVLDLWPDALKSGGGITSERILSLVDRLVRFTYRQCTKILISSKGFRNAICAKGDFDDKIEYFPNWSEDIFVHSNELKIPRLPDGFKIILAGNLGRSQNLESVMRAALLTQSDKRIKWILIGDGSKKEWLDHFIAEHGLSDTVFVLGRFPLESMPSFYRQADAMLLTLRSDFSHLKLVVPARLQSYMAAGRPVLAMIEGGGAEIISESGCGFAVGATDAEALVRVIYEKVFPDRKGFEAKGAKGRAFFNEYFSKEKCINHLISIIRK